MPVRASDPDVFEELLLRELIEFQRRRNAEQRAVEPGELAARRRRRVAVPSVASVASVAASIGVVVLVVALVVLVAHPGRSRRVPATASKPPSAPATAPSLRLRMIAAVSGGPRDVIMHSVSRYGSVVNEVWSDQAAFSLRLMTFDRAGGPVRDIAMRREGARGETLRIDYGARTWTMFTTVVPNAARIPPLTDLAAAWRESLTKASGVTTVGTETIDGVETTHVRFALPDGGVDDAWVDPATYLPVKQIGAFATTTYEWLPRTDANRAELWPTLPAGFRRVAPPAPPTLPTPLTAHR